MSNFNTQTLPHRHISKMPRFCAVKGCFKSAPYLKSCRECEENHYHVNPRGNSFDHKSLMEIIKKGERKSLVSTNSEAINELVLEIQRSIEHLTSLYAEDKR